MTVNFQGMSTLLNYLEDMGKRVDYQVRKKALVAGAEVLKEKAKESVPVRTGKLQANIIISDVQGEEIHVGPDQQGTAFYGHFLEFGTSKMDAQPFLGPALENNKDELEAKMAEVIKRELGLT
ncbi:HK97-gp10 family putative phage morphogenesis protein [Neobacillus niacini]|uniref:HK97-gp10 family putative phage morphogenesis protein n=1 Tax=Neobacillus niacini TaxID=86668 RepID=UPI003000B4CC